MNKSEDIINYIDIQANNHRQLCHASNLMRKWHEGRMTKNQTEAWLNIIDQYYNYIKFNFSLAGYDDQTINKRVVALNKYYNFFYDNKYDNIFTSQGKLRPTILEEFMFLLFRDYVNDLKKKYNDNGNVIDSGSAKAYTNLYFTSSNFQNFIESPTIEINVKDQDFAIYRDFSLNINGKNKTIKIPVVAIENKTYIDKTMLEGIISTAEKIKTGNPYALFIAVSENYDVDLTVDPAYSRIDQIYVLRKCRRKEAWTNIDSAVVHKVFKHVQQHIERPWSDVESKMRNEGIII